MEKTLMVDLSQLCRMCARCCNNNLYTYFLTSNSPITLRLRNFLNIQLELDDPILPKQICQPCCEILEQWSEVHERVRKTHNFFQRQIHLHHRYPRQINNALDFVESCYVKEEIEDVPDIVIVDPDVQPEDGSLEIVNVVEKVKDISCEEGETIEDEIEIREFEFPDVETEVIVIEPQGNHVEPQGNHVERQENHVEPQENDESNSIETLYSSNEVNETCNEIINQQREHFSTTSSNKPPVNPKSQIKFKIPCGCCNTICTNLKDFQKHMEKHSSFPCGVCKIDFDNLINLGEHIQAHINKAIKKNVARCKECKKYFKTRKYLELHIQNKHPPNKRSVANKTTNSVLPSRYFECEICKANFTNVDSYLSHCSLKHPNVVFPCKECDLVFQNALILLMHEKKHHPNKSSQLFAFKCSYCNMTYRNKTNLLNHVQHKHKVREIRKRNPKGSSNRSLLISSHSATKSGDSDHMKNTIMVQSNTKYPYICALCKINFDQFIDFASHMSLNHAEATKIPCGNCGIIFEELPELIQHERSHKESLQFQCKICNAIFATIPSLQDHMLQLHSDVDQVVTTVAQEEEVTVTYDTYIKPKTSHACEYCPEVCITKKKLQKHKRLHKTVHCKMCKSLFYTDTELDNHFKRVHLKLKTVPCPICGKLFKTLQTMKIHKDLHSNERNYVCEICAKTYKTLAYLYSHKKVHNSHRYHCDFCDKACTYKSQIKSHIMLHIQYKPYKCKICKLRFVTVSNLRIHNEQKHLKITYYCIKCRKGFVYREHWRRHMNLVCEIPKDQLPYVKDRQFISPRRWQPKKRDLAPSIDDGQG